MIEEMKKEIIEMKKLMDATIDCIKEKFIVYFYSTKSMY